MNNIKIVINATLDPDKVSDLKAQGYTDTQILNIVKTKFNAMPLFTGIVSDFEVESVEVKG